MSLGIIVEGPSDEEALKEIFQKYDLHPDFRLIPGGFPTRKINRLGELLRRKGHQRVLFLKDTECKDVDTRREELRNKLELLDFPVFFVQCALEAWLLADKKAVESVVGEEITNFPNNPEEISDPTDTLNRIFEKHIDLRHKYVRNKPKNAREIASKLEVEKIEEKCNSFQEVIDFVTE